MLKWNARNYHDATTCKDVCSCNSVSKTSKEATGYNKCVSDDLIKQNCNYRPAFGREHTMTMIWLNVYQNADDMDMKGSWMDAYR